MKNTIKILGFTGMFLFAKYTCAMHENFNHLKNSTNLDGNNSLTYEKTDNNKVMEKYGNLRKRLTVLNTKKERSTSGLRWKPEENANWKWTSNELDDGLDAIYSYAEKAIQKVTEEYSSEMERGGFDVARKDFNPYMWSHGSLLTLVKNAGTEETEFSLRFAQSPFMAFLVAWNYFNWRECRDKKYRLFPSMGPSRKTLRTLYNEFKNEDFSGCCISPNQRDTMRRKKRFSEAIKQGEHFFRLLSEAQL